MLINEFKSRQEQAKQLAHEMVTTVESFDEIADILSPWHSTDMLIYFLELYQEKNIYYNSPLAKVMRELEG